MPHKLFGGLVKRAKRAFNKRMERQRSWQKSRRSRMRKGTYYK